MMPYYHLQMRFIVMAFEFSSTKTKHGQYRLVDIMDERKAITLEVFFSIDLLLS